MDNEIRQPDRFLDKPKYRDFLRLLVANQNRIFGFIIALTADWSDADDIMQETILVMWEKFGTFEPGTHFASWGISIARYKVIQYMEKKQDKRMLFSSKALENITSKSNLFEHSDERIKALRECLQKLEEKHQKCIRMRYMQKMKIKQIAEETSRPIHGMYKFMSRIQYALQKCIESTLSSWGAA